MHAIPRFRFRVQHTVAGLFSLAILSLVFASCSYPNRGDRRTDTDLTPGAPKPNNFFHQTSYAAVRGTVPEIPDAEYVDDDSFCETCHETYFQKFQDNVHRGLREGQTCEACHGPASEHVRTRGKEPGLIISFKNLDPASSAEICLKCHEENACTPGGKWRTSKHANCGVTCTSCHNAHYNVPPGTPSTTDPSASASLPGSEVVRLTSFQEDVDSEESDEDKLPSLKGTSNNLNAVAPYVCYKCHDDMREFQELAGPHQILGDNCFNCTTCHDAHGNLVESSRKELCLQCHGNQTPTMAWHSSIHDLNGVACTDCHNPHPSTCVPRIVDVSHETIRRPQRIPMSVDDPQTCYKCHSDVYGKMNLPSHHPVREGKMICSDCHDPHGQAEGSLREPTLNLVCWRCHAEKEGPFVWEHPPVTEDCSICHDPHGTVVNNMLHQPATFLCLRCHNGHRNSRGRENIDEVFDAQAPFYTDCSQCHSQVHGSDHVNQTLSGTMMTR